MWCAYPDKGQGVQTVAAGRLMVRPRQPLKGSLLVQGHRVLAPLRYRRWLVAPRHLPPHARFPLSSLKFPLLPCIVRIISSNRVPSLVLNSYWAEL